MTTPPAAPTTLRLGQQARRRIVHELTQTVSGATGVFVFSVRGVPVPALESLRKSLGAVAADLAVVKNSLGRRALTAAGFPTLETCVEGTCGVSLTRADPAAVSKVLVTFAKAHEGFTLRGAVVEGQPMPAAAIAVLAALPSRDVLRAQFVGSLQSPIRGFVGVLHGVIRKFVGVLDAVRESKTKSS